MAGLPGAAALAGTPFRRAAPVVLDLAPLRRHGHLPGTEGRGLRRRRRPSRLLASHHREAARAAAGSGPTDLSRSCRLPIPVLRVSGTPQRSETRPRAERRAPRRAAVLPWAERGHYPQRRATPEPPRSFRRGAAAVHLPKPLAGVRARAKQPPFGLLAPAGPGRQGRAAGGVAARLPPPRPAPGLRGATGLRSRAPEVTSARPADPAQRLAAPSPKASAPPPTPQPRRQPR